MLCADTAFSNNFTVSVAKDANGGGKSIVVTAKDGGTLNAADNDFSTAANATAVAGYSDGTVSAAASVGIKFDTAANAQASITLIDKQIQTVSTARATLGASQNRLEYAVQTIGVATPQASAFTDPPGQMSTWLTKCPSTPAPTSCPRAGTAMLAQANQSTQGVLQLLR